jgi:hypothetical protein
MIKPIPKKFDEKLGSARYSPKWGAFMPDDRQAFMDNLNVMAWRGKKDVQKWIDEGFNNPYYPVGKTVTWKIP